MRFLFYGVLVCSLVGCGFKGALYLPPDESKHIKNSTMKSTVVITNEDKASSTIIRKEVASSGAVKVEAESVASAAVN